MAKYWCVNFEFPEVLHHGIKNRCWLMGYQYSPDGLDPPARKAAITRNWKRLEEISEGDKFVAYLSGNKYYATATVIAPRRSAKRKDRIDKIADYLERGEAYDSGYVYFPPTVAYENFEDWGGHYPVRIDVDEWSGFVPDGVVVKGPPVPRYKTVYAAFNIEKPRFAKISKTLSTEQTTKILPEEVDPKESQVEGAAKTITVNAFERNRKARSQCIEHYGWTCSVCGYDMADLYGRYGEGVVHVHHVRELSRLRKEYQVDPIEDLRPVCPNCHAILHTTTPAMTIQKLQKILIGREQVAWPAC